MKNEIIWDKTNIGENYPGVTAPLTYSFIRNAYANVYTNFLKLVGVTDVNREVTYNMLGYINGQVYYNINNWYELVKMLPGYKYNKDFFENMLDPVENKKESTDKITLSWLLKNNQLILNFFSKIVFIKPYYKKFDQEFNQYYNEYEYKTLSKMTEFELVSLLDLLKERFFSTWAYTIVNDFRVMIYFGVLTKLLSKYFPKDTDSKINSIYGIRDKPLSYKQLKELLNIAQFVRADASYMNIFTKDSVEITMELKIPVNNSLRIMIESYIENYGERSFNELKLEETNFKQNPEFFISILKSYVNSTNAEFDSLYNKFNNDSSYELNTNGLNVFQKILLHYFQREAVSSIFKREEFRLKRAKVFNIAREIYLELASRLVAAGDIENKSDVFYLYSEEVENYVRFHELPFNIKDIIKDRKQKLLEYNDEILPRRIVTSGLPNEKKFNVTIPIKTNRLKGKPTSNGFLENTEVVVMKALDLYQKVNGKILVAHATDPGWTIIFPLIKGIIIEEGGLLSHASILAREFGIPCIVVPDALSWLQTGDKVDLNTAKSEVVKR